MIPSKIWNIPPSSLKENEGGDDEAGIHPVVAEILARRGITSTDEIISFLAPSLSRMLDPALLSGVRAAVERLLAALTNREKICIYGDYDVDGITATALMVAFLRDTGFDCSYFIPHRIDNGYGLSMDALGMIANSGARVIVSVDCGITAVNEAIFCRERGIDLIITDHHSPPEQLPEACALINPNIPGCSYPFKGLAGVGVAFNLLTSLRSAMREKGFFSGSAEPDLRRYLDLVALGTIADIVPLTGQNRIYVSYGLRLMNDSARHGITSLKRCAGISGPVSCGMVGFRLAPRLNAAGRLESAVPGVELLLSSDASECDRIAAELSSINSGRQEIERSILEDAIRMFESSQDAHRRRTIVLASEQWHQGVVGIVASRMVERYHRPTILAAIDAEGNVKGSGRSIPAFHLLDALSACSSHVSRFGGHKHAAGLSLRTENFIAFAESFEHYASKTLSDDDMIPSLEIDAVVQPDQVDKRLVVELLKIAPFGAGNSEPVLVMRNLKVLDSSRPKGEHLKLRLSSEGIRFSAIGFGMAGKHVPQWVDIAFSPEINEWNGSSTLQLKIRDFREATQSET